MASYQKLSVTILYFPFNPYQIQCQVMFAYSCNVGLLENLKSPTWPTLVACIASPSDSADVDTAPPASALFPKGGIFSPSRALSFRTGFITQLLGSRAEEFPMTSSWIYMNTNLPRQCSRWEGRSCCDRFYYFPRHRNYGPVIPSHHTVTSAGSWRGRVSFS